MWVMDFVFWAPSVGVIRAAWTELCSPTTDTSAPVDIPELVCGKVRGKHRLNHTGMRKLRSLGQYTGIGYTDHGGRDWRMAYTQKKCVMS